MNGLPITYLEPCLFRNSFNEPWRCGLFLDFDAELVYPFMSGEHHVYAEIAPLAGNEKKVGLIDDAYGLIDREALKEMGL